MDIKKWIKRKYPKYHKLITIIFDYDKISVYIKNNKYQFAVLIKDIGIYKKGTLFLVKRSGHFEEENAWDGTYDIYGLFYCGQKVTASGYHHISIFSEDYYMILDE